MSPRFRWTVWHLTGGAWEVTRCTDSMSSAIAVAGVSSLGPVCVAPCGVDPREAYPKAARA